MFSGQMRPEVLHTFVDTFVEGKKAQVKQRLRQAMETVLDDLFGELLGQLKDMLLPAIGANRAGIDTGGGHQTAEGQKQTRPKSPPSRSPVYAVKSKPNTSAGGGKRPREPDPASPAIVVEIQYAGDDLASSEQHQEAITATKKARTELDESTAPLDLDPQSNPDDDDSGPALPPPPPVNVSQAKFICSSPGCGKRFKKNSHLKDHERLHSGATPFICKFPGCSHSGKQRTHVLSHIRSVHLKHLEPGQENDPKAYLEVNEELLK